MESEGGREREGEQERGMEREAREREGGREGDGERGGGKGERDKESVTYEVLWSWFCSLRNNTDTLLFSSAPSRRVSTAELKTQQ